MDADQIRQFAESCDIEQLILQYDADFDVPLEHGYALGVLRMTGTFEPIEQREVRAVAQRVGAHWCDIIYCDMTYDHWTALRRIEAAEADAAWLAGQPRNEFAEYALTRWHDGIAKIYYRLGGFTRSLPYFRRAAELAESAELWWCLPDIRSNVLRCEWEQGRQAGSPGMGGADVMLRAEIDAATSTAAGRAIDIESASGDHRVREFRRGVSSLLHNLAVVLKGGGPRHRDESLRVSLRSERISRALGDKFRIVQSVHHQAQLLDDSLARDFYAELATMEYPRGRLMARQHIGRLTAAAGDPQGAVQLGALLGELLDNLHAGSSIGTDIDIADFTMRFYVTAVAALPERERREREEGLSRLRERLADAIRRAVALPAYKRAYASAVRPSFLERIAAAVAELDGPHHLDRAEQAFGLVEASSARELLDMMATADLPPLEVPTSAEPSDAPEAAPAETDEDADSPRLAEMRRAAVTSQHQSAQAEILAEMARREAEFENRFLTQPLEAARHDPEIAHRLQMYTVNQECTCVVRYFAYGPAQPDLIGAFVVQNGCMRVVTGIRQADVRDLAQRLLTPSGRHIVEPTRAECEEIWDLLVGPVWAEIDEPDELRHLVLIPTDEIFAIPLHVAWQPGTEEPLAVRVPLSQAVSATAFVDRGRNLLKRQPVSLDDDLAAIVVAGNGVSGRELLHTGWKQEHMILAGRYPAALEHVEKKFRADGVGLRAIADDKPEFFVYSGHGNFNEAYDQYGPYLVLPDGEFLTQYDVAMRLRLPRNKLTILGACLAGQGAQTGGGDIGGFLRALMATGAGAIAVPLWSVKDRRLADTARNLLRASRDAAKEGNSFDVVATLHQYYRDVAAHTEPHRLVESLPLTVYL
jgi:tetratricopeptide (TPR) repeat protein